MTQCCNSATEERAQSQAEEQHIYEYNERHGPEQKVGKDVHEGDPRDAKQFNRWTRKLHHIISGHCGLYDWSLPFQEYSDLYPHKEGTLGWSGRPGGPEFYVSIMDNSENHGPGGQPQAQNPYEADTPIGTIVEGYSTTIARLKEMDNAKAMAGEYTAFIGKMTILVPNEAGEYKKWSVLQL